MDYDARSGITALLAKLEILVSAITYFVLNPIPSLQHPQTRASFPCAGPTG